MSRFALKQPKIENFFTLVCGTNSFHRGIELVNENNRIVNKNNRFVIFLIHAGFSSILKCYS